TPFPYTTLFRSVDLISFADAGNMPKVKLQAAFDVVVQCGRRQFFYLSQAVACQLVEYGLVFRHFNRVDIPWPYRRVEYGTLRFMTRFKKQLLQVSTHLALTKYIC